MVQPTFAYDDPAPEPDTAVGRLTREISRSKQAELSRLFVGAGAGTPRIVWSPAAHEFRHPLLARFAHICGEHLQTNGRIRVNDFDLSRFSAIRRWVMTLDVIDPDGEFAFDYFGEGIANSYGSDLTGRPISELAPHVSLFYTALYRAACMRKESFLSEHEPPRQIFVQSWLRLFVPIFDRNDTVVKFVAVNYPENALRAGLEIIPDPIMIVDAQMVVRFANMSAREAFGKAHHWAGPKPLADYIGCGLRLDHTPGEMLQTDTVDNQIVSLRIGQALADDFLITISATNYGGNAFYVIMVRPVTPGQ